MAKLLKFEGRSNNGGGEGNEDEYDGTTRELVVLPNWPHMVLTLQKWWSRVLCSACLRAIRRRGTGMTGPLQRAIYLKLTL